MHPGIDQCLHEHEDVGRACAAEGSGHVEIPLVADEQFHAQRAENGLGLAALVGRHLRRGRPDSHALADLGRGVGHGPDDGGVGHAVGQLTDGRTGQNRQQQVLPPQVAADTGHNLGQVLRLDRQDDDLPGLGRLSVADGRADAIAPTQVVESLGHRVGDDDLLRGDDVSRDQAANHRLAHDAAADEGYILVCKHGVLLGRGIIRRLGRLGRFQKTSRKEREGREERKEEILLAFFAPLAFFA